MTRGKHIDGWWSSAGRVLPPGDGRRIRVGATHEVEGEIIPCERGLHASARAIDALQYAPGPIVWKVRLSGVVVPHGDDKHAASRRTYLAGGIDVSDTLREFARRCALDVIHLWDAPEIVVRYLKTGDETIRDAAWAATRDACAARDAAWAAAGDARAAARAAASAAAWDAACAAGDAARDAAWAAGDAASAAEAAARAAQNRRLTRMLNAAIKS